MPSLFLFESRHNISHSGHKEAWCQESGDESGSSKAGISVSTHAEATVAMSGVSRPACCAIESELGSFPFAALTAKREADTAASRFGHDIVNLRRRFKTAVSRSSEPLRCGRPRRL